MKRSGFTLVELLVVIAMIGMLKDNTALKLVDNAGWCPIPNFLTHSQ
jgi:prepilin-type N-terminal cleavage/methylation domain-containing protein